LEGTSVGHLVQPSCWSRVTYSRLHRTASRWVLNIYWAMITLLCGIWWRERAAAADIEEDQSKKGLDVRAESRWILRIWQSIII